MGTARSGMKSVTGYSSLNTTSLLCWSSWLFWLMHHPSLLCNLAVKRRLDLLPGPGGDYLSTPLCQNENTFTDLLQPNMPQMTKNSNASGLVEFTRISINYIRFVTLKNALINDSEVLGLIISTRTQTRPLVWCASVTSVVFTKNTTHELIAWIKSGQKERPALCFSFDSL